MFGDERLSRTRPQLRPGRTVEEWGRCATPSKSEVVAEEVGAVVLKVVSWEENGKDARGVDYARLTALLIEETLGWTGQSAVTTRSC